jgi:hypothetical protein
MAIVACDFFVSVMATFQVLYVFIAMEIARDGFYKAVSRSIPGAQWITQQFREIPALTSDTFAESCAISRH